MASANGIPDWRCPNTSCINHEKKVFGSKESCPKCGSSREDVFDRGSSAGERPDDWECPNENCLNHTKKVFGSKIACPKCGAARDAKNPGDWICPNQMCVNNKNAVFASKVSCPKCGTLRPNQVPRQSAFASMRGQMGGRGGGPYDGRPGHAMMGGCKGGAMVYGGQMGKGAAMVYGVPMGGKGKGAPMFYGGGRSYGGGMPVVQMLPVSSVPGGRPGDWICPTADCVNHKRGVFAKNTTCPQCGADKPRGNTTGGNREGDWKCPNPDCLNHTNKVFGKHATCPKCGTENPDL
eukprot:TRINITY_DN8210_c0_g1_i1.p1 TRINITY_DN8210_c0_g1~~TRINITY_DN8210_c0_g1_i1.p1  ORF type:complete len:314 (-),score=22.03 TRINITY_DN8210_c0_g1_i1:188-1066(-)